MEVGWCWTVVGAAVAVIIYGALDGLLELENQHKEGVIPAHGGDATMRTPLDRYSSFQDLRKTPSMHCAVGERPAVVDGGCRQTARQTSPQAQARNTLGLVACSSTVSSANAAPYFHFSSLVPGITTVLRSHGIQRVS